MRRAPLSPTLTSRSRDDWIQAVSRDLARAKERYETHKGEAQLRAAQQLRPHLEGRDFRLGRWGARAQEAYSVQWKQRHADSGWDWPELFRNHREPDRLDIVVWASEERLAALGLAVTTQRSVELRFLEGDFRPECPLKGVRALIVLECVANYAQGMGKEEVRLRPVNDNVAALYRETYGFELVSPRREEPYYVKRI